MNRGSTSNALAYVMATCQRLNPGWSGNPDDELQIDSLDLMELAFELEERFGLTIPDADLATLSTPRKLAAWIEAHALDGEPQ